MQDIIKMSGEVEEVGEKIDRLNGVIYQLMSDLNNSHFHSTRFSMMSSIHSFNENADEYASLSSDHSQDDIVIPQQYLDKFQESLTEIDRLNMKIEDIMAEKLRNSTPESHIYLNKDQITDLIEFLTNAVKNTEDFVMFRVDSTSLRSGELNLASQELYGKLKELEVENINLRSQFLSLQVQKDKNMNLSQNHVDIQAELEIKQIEISKKEQELLCAQEEYEYKTIQSEFLINEYKNKLEEINQKSFVGKNLGMHKKSPSQDITRARTPVSVLYPISNSFACSLLSNRQEIEKKIAFIENLVLKKHLKKKIPKNRREIEKYSDMMKEFGNRERTFQKKLETFGSFPAKEKFIISYLDKQTKYLQKKLDEVRQYEIFLQETWTTSNGSASGIEAVKLASSRNFMRSKDVLDREEVLNHNYLRLQKLKDSIKSENTKLQDHRKKILIERKKYSKQQADIEVFLKSFRNFTKNINA